MLCRRWDNRVKGRDWYDLVWYCTHHPQLHLSHLEQRMRQSGHYNREKELTPVDFIALVGKCIDAVDLEQAQKDVLPFVKQPEMVNIWSADFFREIVKRIEFC